MLLCGAFSSGMGEKKTNKQKTHKKKTEKQNKSNTYLEKMKPTRVQAIGKLHLVRSRKKTKEQCSLAFFGNLIFISLFF